MRFLSLLLPILPTLLAACSLPSALERGAHMDQLAQAQHWHKLRLPAGEFVLTGFQPDSPPSDPLTIYIEGDGMAWLTPELPSENPTPRQPMALELALRHPGSAVAYLARPCQNAAAADWGNCRVDHWTDQRYSEAVVAASNQAISALKQSRQAKKLILVGYSGGGSIAALVAARRDDVIRLITVAGNLDIQTWARGHRLPPLQGSLNPADAAPRLRHIAQLHFVGTRDRVVTPDVVQAYIGRFPPENQPALRLIDADHGCCWVELWPELAKQAFAPVLTVGQKP